MMKKLTALSLLAISTLSFAAPISNSSNGYSWNKATASEKNAYVKKIQYTAGAPAKELRDCPDEVYNTNETYILRQSVSELATMCALIIRG
ncbi:hypothetical protein V9W64_06560 [Neisseria leonii]|uniref:Uncharacterized protein n=1 Tax=Neisseria leonii TaxID=2995413 RepID=A0A9X4IB00_9NEIS|nr:hypothetical protein [Neisseria sp. 51.81]MDD9327894.1 hypothetical protein [Neisseria sp. 51.81]